MLGVCREGTTSAGGQVGVRRATQHGAVAEVLARGLGGGGVLPRSFVALNRELQMCGTDLVVLCHGPGSRKV